MIQRISLRKHLKYQMIYYRQIAKNCSMSHAANVSIFDGAHAVRTKQCRFKSKSF